MQPIVLIVQERPCVLQLETFHRVSFAQISRKSQENTQKEQIKYCVYFDYLFVHGCILAARNEGLFVILKNSYSKKKNDWCAEP